MILDSQLQLSDAQLVNNSDTASDNTFDTGAAATDIFAGRAMGVLFGVDVTATSNDGDETYEFQVIQSAAENLGTPDILAKTDTSLITRTVLVAGYMFTLLVGAGLKTKRYLGAYYNIGGTTAVVTMSAWIADYDFIRKLKNYAKGYSIHS